MAVNRRLVLESPDVFKFSEETIRESPPDGVVVKVQYAGICHSDVHIMVGNSDVALPRILGHEVSGVVHSMGKQAAQARPDIKVGVNVCVYPWAHCNECTFCRADYTSCIEYEYGSGAADNYTYGICRDGGYQNYMIVDRVSFLHKVPKTVQMDQAAILTCSGVTSMNAVEALRETIDLAIQANGTALVAVVGTGGLALWAIPILKARYSSKVKVIAVDISDVKLVDAAAAGADLTHKWGTKESAEEAAARLVTACGRPHAIIDFIGRPEVIKRGYLALCVGGTICLVGLAGPTVPEMTQVIARHITIRGVLVGTQDQCRRLLDMVDKGKVRPPPISHVTLDEVPAVLNLLKAGKQRGRAVVTM